MGRVVGGHAWSVPALTPGLDAITRRGKMLMMTKKLAAAGIADPTLVASYQRCRKLNAKHGRTYYLATLLLPPEKRPYVHALYGMARYADDLVDTVQDNSAADRAEALFRFRDQFLSDLALGRSAHPIGAAAVHTATRWSIPAEYFEAFFTSMEMDLRYREYATFDELATYVYGSAAVIGLQMVPILEPTGAAAFDSARDLGVAFQLANFIRDIDEDLDRGRIYLPLDELAKFDVSPADLAKRIVTDQLRNALDFQIQRVRGLQAAAEPGIALLHPTCQPCIQTASTLYCGIVDEVERMDYQVFTYRAQVGLRRRLTVALPAWRQARRARHRFSLNS